MDIFECNLFMYGNKVDVLYIVGRYLLHYIMYVTVIKIP